MTPQEIVSELDRHIVGQHDAKRAVAIAQHIDRASALNFAGMLFYPGHIREAVGEQGSSLTQLGANIATYVQAFEAAGLPPRVVSGGSTPAAWRMHEVPGVNEVRPGTYVYNDRTTAMIGACDWGFGSV